MVELGIFVTGFFWGILCAIGLMEECMTVEIAERLLRQAKARAAAKAAYREEISK
jgi:polyferredoxin